MLCQECTKRTDCTELCEEAEGYVNQDYQNQVELTVGLKPEGEFPVGSSVYLTDTERAVLTLLGKGLTRADVCQVLDITRGALRFHLSNLRKKARKP